MADLTAVLTSPAAATGFLRAVTLARAKGHLTREQHLDRLTQLVRVTHARYVVRADVSDSEESWTSIYFAARLAVARANRAVLETGEVLADLVEMDGRCSRDLPDSDPVARAVRAELGNEYRRSGDLDRSIEIHETELQIRQSLFGEDAYITESVRTDLAGGLRERAAAADLTRVDAMTRTMILRREKQYGTKHALTSVARMSRVLFLFERSESTADESARRVLLGEAFDLARMVAATRRETLGVMHDATVRAMRAQARALLAMGKPRAASWVLMQIRAIEEVIGPRRARDTEYLLALALRDADLPGDRERARDIIGSRLAELDDSPADRSLFARLTELQSTLV